MPMSVPFRDLATLLDAASPEPMALQLARLLSREILDGRILPGSPLPGSRVIAEGLGITRHVVVSALWELELEGWVVSQARGGTYVSKAIPTSIPNVWGLVPTTTSIPEEPPFDLPSQLLPITSLIIDGQDLSEGLPDPRLAPKEALAKGYQRALRRHGDHLLGRGEPRGNLALRENLAKYMQDHRGVKASVENIFIPRSIPLSLALIASALLSRGGHIAVEDPGDPAHWDALRSVTGVILHPIPVDSEGLNVERLETLLAHQHLDLIVLTPHYQVPTTTVLSSERRTRILELASLHGLAIVENDPGFDYYGPGGPMLPLAACDQEGRVIHLGSLSHLMAPSLGLSFVAASKALVDRLARLRKHQDVQGDRVLEWTVADLIRDGDFERHLARVRPVYTERRALFSQMLFEELGDGFHLQPLTGGLAGWVQTPETLDLNAWAFRCREAGVKIRPGQHYDFHKKTLPFIHLGFGGFKPEELRSALRRMASRIHT